MTEPETLTPLAIEYAIAMDANFSNRVAMGCVHVAREMYAALVTKTDPQSLQRRSFAISIIGDRPANFAQYAALVVSDPDTRRLNLIGPDDERLTDERIVDVLRMALYAITEIQ